MIKELLLASALSGSVALTTPLQQESRNWSMSTEWEEYNKNLSYIDNFEETTFSNGSISSYNGIVSLNGSVVGGSYITIADNLNISSDNYTFVIETEGNANTNKEDYCYIYLENLDGTERYFNYVKKNSKYNITNFTNRSNLYKLYLVSFDTIYNNFKLKISLLKGNISKDCYIENGFQPNLKYIYDDGFNNANKVSQKQMQLGIFYNSTCDIYNDAYGSKQMGTINNYAFDKGINMQKLLDDYLNGSVMYGYTTFTFNLDSSFATIVGNSIGFYSVSDYKTFQLQAYNDLGTLVYDTGQITSQETEFFEGTYSKIKLLYRDDSSSSTPFENGYVSCGSGIDLFNKGYNIGLNDGFYNGFHNGINDKVNNDKWFNKGVEYGKDIALDENLTPFGWLSSMGDLFSNIFSIELAHNFTIGGLLLIPLMLSVVGLVLGLFFKGRK